MSANIEICIGGLERSGNTFLRGSIGYTLGINAGILDSHQITSLINHDRSIPLIVPVRDAIDSLTSAKIYRDYIVLNNIYENDDHTHAQYDSLIKRYTAYTQYLIDNPDLFIAPFKEFTKDHNAVIDVISECYNFKAVQRLSAQAIIEMVGENPKLDNEYLGNFPRNKASEYEEIKSIFNKKYSKEVSAIQSNINNLYLTYYERLK